jgi:protein TonB
MFSFLYKVSENRKVTRAQADQSKVIKIKFNKKKPKQIVNSVKSKQNRESDKVKYLSKDSNFFDRETVSKKVESFKMSSKGKQNGQHHLTKNRKAKKNNQKKTIKKKKKFSLSNLGVVDIKKDESDLARVKKGSPDSNSKDHIASNNDFIDEEMPLGELTRLNTQKYKFYGFYFRIRQKLEQFWGVSLKQKAEVLFKSGRRLPSGGNLITNLEITINRNGKIVSIKVLGTSGFKELDQAAIDSFNQAGPFPNPPKDLVQNGKAIINWGFVVTS